MVFDPLVLGAKPTNLVERSSPHDTCGLKQPGLPTEQTLNNCIVVRCERLQTERFRVDVDFEDGTTHRNILRVVAHEVNLMH